MLVLSAMLMQGIAYYSMLILVHDSFTMWSGVLGAGVGALVGLRIPERWLSHERN